MMSVTSWVGQAGPIQLIANQNLPLSYQRTNYQLPNPQVRWNPSPGPPGKSDQSLQATFQQGYIVSYDVSYQLTGYMYTDPYQNTYFNIYTSYLDKNGQQQTIFTSTSQSTKNNWNFGPNGDSPAISVPGLPGPPVAYGYQTTTTNVCQCGTPLGNGCCHYPQGVTLNMLVTVNVADNCGSGTLKDPICRSICSANPEQCKADYDFYCLNNSYPDRIAEPVCTTFYANWIRNHASDTFIDTQAKLYCRKYYKGFADLDPRNPNPNRTVDQRTYDLQICGCNLTEPNEPLDPGINLYQNYFDNLVKQHPGYANYGQQVRCTYSPCASSLFWTKEIPKSGCNVPQCVIDPSVNNNGVINGNVDIDITVSGCSTIEGADTDETILTTVLVVLFILVIIIIFVYFLYSPTKPRKSYTKPNGAPITN